MNSGDANAFLRIGEPAVSEQVYDADLIAVTAAQIIADAKGLERLYERSPNARRGNDPERLRNTAALIASAPETVARLATVEMERDELRRRLESAERHRLQMTGLQIQHIWDFIDKDLETEVLVFYAEERKDIETGELMPAGLYVSLVDYPDEGCMYLPQDAEAALALLSPSSEAGKGDV